MGKFAFTLLALIASTGCSFVFQSEEAASGDAGSSVEPDAATPGASCEGQGALFPAGMHQGNGRFEYIDLNQGTITFWVRALAPVETEVPLGFFMGFGISASPNGISAGFSDQVGLTNTSIQWDPGVDHFVSLRWDTNHPLSGTSAGNEDVELRVDGDVVAASLLSSFNLVFDPADDLLVFGFGNGQFHVDQVVIYDRPLFDNSGLGGTSELSVMAVDKRDAGMLFGGGFGVLLAMASPRDENCQPEAWTMSGSGVFAGDFPLGNEGTNASPNFTNLDPLDRIFATGGFYAADQQALELIVPVAEQSRFVLEVLSHGSPGSQTQISVTASTGTPLVSHTADSGTRTDPLRSILTFESGNATSLNIALNATGVLGAFHSLSLRSNLLDEAGFEAPIDDGSAWTHTFDADNSPIMYNTNDPYAGSQSACLASLDAPDVLLQAPDGMSDHNFYLFGSQMKWTVDNVTRPGVHVSNGSLFATGVPYSARKKAFAAARETSQWHTVGAVGRRLRDSTLDAHNDLIRLGTHSKSNPSKPTGVCLDSAYTIPLEKLQGIAGPFPTEDE